MDRLRHPRVGSSSIMGRGNRHERETGDVKFQTRLPPRGGGVDSRYKARDVGVKGQRVLVGGHHRPRDCFTSPLLGLRGQLGPEMSSCFQPLQRQTSNHPQHHRRHLSSAGTQMQSSSHLESESSTAHNEA